MSSSLDLRSLLPDGWRETRIKLPPRPVKKTRRVHYIPTVPKTASVGGGSGLRYSSGPLAYLCDDMAQTIAEQAVLFYNQTNSPEYELVKPLHCMLSPYDCTYHSNFIARMKNEQRDDGQGNGETLFFAEMKIKTSRYVRADDDPLSCLVCCIIGPRFTRTGERGCFTCKKHRGLIQHPQNMDYTPSTPEL